MAKLTEIAWNEFEALPLEEKRPYLANPDLPNTPYHTPHPEMRPVQPLNATEQKAEEDEQRGPAEHIQRDVLPRIASRKPLLCGKRECDAGNENEERKYAVVQTKTDPVHMRHLNGQP